MRVFWRGMLIFITAFVVGYWLLSMMIEFCIDLGC
jgi:hypothetical protein